MTAQTCFTDGLHHIFSFLPLSDISSSSSVCRRWSSAVSSEPPRAVRCDLRSVAELRELATSKLRRHVHTLDLMWTTGGGSSLLLVDDLPELICRRMPSLTHLLCAVDLQRVDHLQFPSALHTLEVKIIDPQSLEDPWHGLPALLSCAARAPLRQLRIGLMWNAMSLPTAAAMEPLRQLRDTITELKFPRLVRSSDIQWTSDHFAIFRSLPHLTRLDIFTGWSDEELELLTAEPTHTHLQSIGSRMFGVSPRSLAAICRLSSLTQLYAMPCLPRVPDLDLALLGRLTRLETLHLVISHQIDFTQVMTALVECTNVTALTLQDIEGVRRLTDAHLCALLPSLTRLRRLRLIALLPFDDLTCLSAASNLAGTLEHLHIEHRLEDGVPPHALMHLRSLRRLQSANLTITSRRTDDTTGSESDLEAIYLPMMEDLKIYISGDGDVDLRGMLGRLPRLRDVRLACEIEIAVPPLLHFLAHASSLTKLDVRRLALTDAHLCSLMPSLPHLRDLDLRGHALTSLRFASASARLAHSLEQLTIADPGMTHSLPANELVYLRSLGALRRLKLGLPFITPVAVGHQEHVDFTDSGAASLASLTNLTINTRRMPSFEFSTLGPRGGPLDSGGLDLSLLGPMPQLRSCRLTLHEHVQVTSIAHALKHSSQLVDLMLDHPSITDHHLVALMPHLVDLTSLVVNTKSRLGGLAFATPAVAPTLAATLTRLTIRTNDTTPMTPSDLHHLRAFANLTSLSLRFPTSRAVLAAELEELTLDSPRFRRDVWPQLRRSVLHCD